MDYRDGEPLGDATGLVYNRSDMGNLMSKVKFSSAIIFILVAILIPAMGYTSSAAQPAHTPYLGLSPDEGFPVWLTPDVENYLPLTTDQTSGLDLIGTQNIDGTQVDWLVSIDDASNGKVNLLAVSGEDGCIDLQFKNNSLTLPPPEISQMNIDPKCGYDFESIAYHSWSDSIFLSHEGSVDEIGIYLGKINYRSGGTDSEGIVTRAGDLKNRPEFISSPILLHLPGWDDVFGQLIRDNMGIEGMACSEDRLFLGFESPYSFTDRLLDEKSTVIAIWKINPANPSDMESCELLAVHDTLEWVGTYGYTIETICGLDALDSNHIVGIDRDWQRLFTAEFDDAGGFQGGRWIYLDAPGPAPVESDGCDALDHLPKLVKPSFESVCLVPAGEDPYYPGIMNYHIYLAVDPWGPGWALNEGDWKCEGYERRLVDLLPALYRYTVSWDTLFPQG